MSLSGGRESLLTRDIEQLKSKLMTKTDELNEAVKNTSKYFIYLAYMTVYEIQLKSTHKHTQAKQLSFDYLSLDIESG